MKTPRPKSSDPAIVLTAARSLAPAVLAWLPAAELKELSEIERDLVVALRFYDDGYEIAKELEQEDYTPDAALVEILDAAFSLKRRAKEEAEKEWVKENCLYAPFIAGDRVSFTMGSGAVKSGVVTENRAAGKSLVRADGQPDGSGYIIEWEKLTSIEEAKPAAAPASPSP